MGKKILLADDSITIQKVIELTFSDEDFEVVTVGNGRLAVEKVQDVRPDLVLCDIIMPEKDGYEVCDFIKKTPSLAHIPVLLLTGAFEPFDQDRANRVGCDGFLAKPFEPQTLIAKVKDLLSQAGTRTVAPTRTAAPPPPAPAPVSAPPASASPMARGSGAPPPASEATFDEVFEEEPAAAPAATPHAQESADAHLGSRSEDFGYVRTQDVVGSPAAPSVPSAAAPETVREGFGWVRQADLPGTPAARHDAGSFAGVSAHEPEKRAPEPREVTPPAVESSFRALSPTRTPEGSGRP